LIVTPSDFAPRLAALEHERPHTFAFRGNQVLLRESDLAAPEASALDGIVDPTRVLPVGTRGNSYFRTTWVAETTPPIAGFAFMGLRSLFGRMDEAMLAIAGRAFQIADWARTHQFCGVCGAPTARVEGERAMKCACGHVFYPRIAPAMMVLVKRGDAILLARSVLVPAGGRMSALAGFLEPGESVEDAVHREVREEVGLEVKDLRYFGSQAWPFPGSLMIAFTAEYAGGDIHCDATEIAEARWFRPGDPLPELSPRQSISRALIDANLGSDPYFGEVEMGV
jgi:NAD+ diphosphatase